MNPSWTMPAAESGPMMSFAAARSGSCTPDRAISTGEWNGLHWTQAAYNESTLRKRSDLSCPEPAAALSRAFSSAVTSGSMSRPAVDSLFFRVVLMPIYFSAIVAKDGGARRRRSKANADAESSRSGRSFVMQQFQPGPTRRAESGQSARILKLTRIGGKQTVSSNPFGRKVIVRLPYHNLVRSDAGALLRISLGYPSSTRTLISETSLFPKARICSCLEFDLT